MFCMSAFGSYGDQVHSSGDPFRGVWIPLFEGELLFDAFLTTSQNALGTNPKQVSHLFSKDA